MEILKPFGPRIAKVKLPGFVSDVLNLEIDHLIEKKDELKNLDVSDTLVGNVDMEYSLRKKFVKDSGVQEMIESSAKNYLKELFMEGIVPNVGNVLLSSIWFVSQKKGDCIFLIFLVSFTLEFQAV